MDSLSSRLINIADKYKQKVAIVVDSESYTYSQLLTDVELMAGYLVENGIGKNDCVAVLFPNGYEFIVTCFAGIKAGATVLPLNSKFQPEELKYYFDSANAKAICCSEDHSLAVPYAVQRNLLRPCLSDARQLNYRLSEDLASDETGLFMFSSGSTGKSKRVFRSQGAALSEFDMMTETIGADQKTCILCTIPMYHAHGFSNAMVLALLNGGTLVVLTNEFNGRKTLAAIEQHQVTIYPAVPFMFQIMALVNASPAFDVSSLKHCFSAGAPLASKIFDDVRAKFNVNIGQIYGSTETGALCVNVSSSETSKATVGMPLNGVHVQFRDENGIPLAKGTEGEIWVKSPAMTNQYDNLPEATRESFVEGWFATGDLGNVSENGLTITGRKKLLIIVAGNKVDPLEVENILNGHNNVKESVVIGKAHETYGEQVTAYVVPQDGATIDEDELIHFIKEQLVEYKVPKQVIVLDEIPKSPLGKVLRKYL